MEILSCLKYHLTIVPSTALGRGLGRWLGPDIAGVVVFLIIEVVQKCSPIEIGSTNTMSNNVKNHETPAGHIFHFNQVALPNCPETSHRALTKAISAERDIHGLSVDICGKIMDLLHIHYP